MKFQRKKTKEQITSEPQKERTEEGKIRWYNTKASQLKSSEDELQKKKL